MEILKVVHQASHQIAVREGKEVNLYLRLGNPFSENGADWLTPSFNPPGFKLLMDSNVDALEDAYRQTDHYKNDQKGDEVEAVRVSDVSAEELKKNGLGTRVIGPRGFDTPSEGDAQ